MTRRLELDPEDIAPLINRAAVFMAKNDPASAASDYTAALKLKSNRPSLLRQRAIAWKVGGTAEHGNQGLQRRF